MRRVYEIKGRDLTKPLLLLIPDVESLSPLVKRISIRARRLMEAFWPGPLTLVFQASESVPRVCLGGGNTVAVRLPNSSVALALLREVAAPVTASSANPSGGPQPTSAGVVASHLGNLVDLIVDGGPCEDDRPSTLVDVTGSQPVVLRPGRISEETLKPFLS